MIEAAADAGLLVVGLSERWREEGVGSVRLALVERSPAPLLLVRRGPRPGGLAPAGSRTRYTWSLADAPARLMRTKSAEIGQTHAVSAVTNSGMLAAVAEPARPSLQLAGAGGTLLGMTAACAVIGAVAGWALGSWPVGLMVGVVVGIPVGIFAVYRRYREAL